MVSREISTIWPDNFRETRFTVNGLMDQLGGKVKNTLLSQDDLEVLNESLEHLQEAWNIKYSNPLVKKGLSVIRDHFARRFGVDINLPPHIKYREIVNVALPSGYFEGQPIGKPELKSVELTSIAILSASEHARKKNPKAEAREKELVLAIVDANVNRGWRPQK